MRPIRVGAVAVLILCIFSITPASAAPRYALAYWYEVGGFQNACCSGWCSCSGTGNHSVYVHVLDSNGNKLGNIRVEDADNPAFYGITNNDPNDKLGFVEIPIYMSGTPAMRVNDSGITSDVSPEMIENRAPTNGHYSWECAFMLIPDDVDVTFNQTLLGTPNLSGGGCDIHAPFTTSCAYYDLDPFNWASDDFDLDSSAASYGQTFVANGDRVVIAKFQTTVGFLQDLRYGVTIRENGPGGTIVGPQAISRLMKSDEYFTQMVTWPLSGPSAAIVTPGNTYYAEIVRVDQAGSINIWRRNTNVYPNGQMYRGGTPVSGLDLLGRIICASTAPAGPTGTISGTVQNLDGLPISSAQVEAQPGGYTTTTNATGQYTLPDVPVGTYDVTASKTGYTSETQNGVSVTESTTTTVNFLLDQSPTAPGTISGVIRDLSGSPIALAAVNLSPGDYGAVTGTDGSYQITSVPPGTYAVAAYAPGKTEQTQVDQTLAAVGNLAVDFNLPASGRVAHIVDDFNGNYIFTGDTLEESFQIGFDNHEYFPEGPPTYPDRVLPPNTGTDHSQKFELQVSNDQYVSYFETKSLYGDDHFLELTDLVSQNGWEPIDVSQPITYIIYVKGVNNIADPDDPQWYWRQTLGVHRPEMYAGSAEIEWKSHNNDTWQMLRTSVTGLQDNSEQWITFESWYPKWLGGQVIDRNWMVWENLMIEYTPVGGPVDTTPPGPVSSFTATVTAAQVHLTWQNPSDTDFQGTRIRYRTDISPTGPTDGTLLTDHAGSPGAADSTTHVGVTEGVTYYYAAFAYDGHANYSTAQTDQAAIPIGVPGDFDHDGDVDQDDFGHLQICLTSPGTIQDDPDCADAKLDPDQDVDQDDFAIFQACMSGANIDADPNCAD